MTLATRTASLVLAALLAVVSSLALAGQPAERALQVDILKVTPEELSGAPAAALERQAQEAYAQRRYEDAARAYIELLRMRRGDPTALYNLACCFGLLGNEAQAILFVQAAWDAGFRDLDHIRHDPDFEKVRSKEYFQLLMAHLQGEAEGRAAFVGRPLDVEAPALATARIVEPDNLRPGTTYPLLIGLHGAGGNAETIAPLFKGSRVAQPFFFCVPEAPYAMAIGRTLNYVWFRPGSGERRSPPALQRKLGDEYVLAVLDAVLKAYPVDPKRVFLMGFSQGGFLAYTAGLKHPERFAGVIPVGTWLDQVDFTAEEMKLAAAHTRVLILHSPDDLAVAPSEARASAAFLARYGVPHELVPYRGGHVLNAEIAKQIATWVTASSSGPTPGAVGPGH
jgi:phospholipase/carboxylesterase